ncbi:monovalent cation/H+ antiporter subunit D [Thermochromatium tepidum]|uniref:Monovalent cation/H+ antiporter subunit D n=1 Tax=Thermochromatium tepidum ATCC 43061 TaxID=316276 RepID=A0A6I6EA93_THETI|nr:monovalent cation/H+ antiporter subunit D [Thermochromatium tepidum]QGU33623.1 monovalent cation/H+ antiporter subunit D [Thermochromatium tepidum ATCC 43061]
MNHLVIAPLLLPLLVGTLLLVSRRTLSLAARRSLSLAAIFGQILFAIELGFLVGDGTILTYHLGHWPAPWGIVLVADRLAVWMLLVTSLLAGCALLHAMHGTDQCSRHFHPLFQLQLFGLNGAFLTGDLFNLFVFFEILLLASYGLLVHGGGAARVRAGLQFVVINLVGSTLFLFAAGAFYGLVGTLNLADLALKVARLPPEALGPAQVAALLLLMVFALKAALVPLHLWLPSAYAATSAPVAALFAIMTKVGAYALLRVETLMFGKQAGILAGLYTTWLLPLGLLTLVLGALGALAATELRLQVAYLVVVSVGLLISAFGLGTADGIAAGLYYLVHTTFATAAFFLVADLILRTRGWAADRLVPGPALPNAGLLGGLFFVTALLVAGLPPLSGFVGKVLILRAALEQPVWPWILGVVLIGGLLGLIALARSGSLLFFNVRGGGASAHLEAGATLPTLGLLSLCLALLIGSGPVFDLARATADQLLDPSDYIHAVLRPIGTGFEP